jgi:predicted site-specific integrase-resolvase
MELDSQPAKVCPAEAARQIGCSVQTLRKIMRRGELGFQKISARKIFVYQTEINQFQKIKLEPRIRI